MKGVSATLALGLALAACNAAVDADGLARVRRTIGATAAEANLLIEETLRRDVTRTYARIHREKLLEHLHDAAEELDRPAPETLAGDAERARQLAVALAGALQSLGDALARGDAAPGNADALKALQQRFTTIRHDAAAS